MSYHANVTAALYLVEQVLPRVWAERPEVRVWLVGKDPPRQVQRLAADRGARVTLTGTVPDVRPYFRRAAVAVVPIPYGAGIQNKVLEAMASGTPVVATPQAVSALAVADGEQALVADGPEAFAAAVLRLLGDPALRTQLGQAGRRYVEQHHDWRSIVERLEEIYGEAIARRKGDFIARLVAHIPDKGQVMQRYYGHYANRTRGARRKAEEAAAAPGADGRVPAGDPELAGGGVTIVEPEDFSRGDARRRWAELIRLVYEVDPMVRPRCGGQMRVIALIQEPAVIGKILKHLRSKGRDGRAGPWATGPPGAGATAEAA